jgi:hypothetical protein
VHIFLTRNRLIEKPLLFRGVFLFCFYCGFFASYSKAGDTTIVHIDQLNHYINIHGQNYFSYHPGSWTLSGELSDHSNLFYRPGQELRLRTENRLYFEALHRSFTLLYPGVYGEFYSLLDEQSQFSNDYQKQAAGLAAAFPNLRGLKGYGGYFTENRLAIDEYGWFGQLLLEQKQSQEGFSPKLDWNRYDTEARSNYKFTNDFRWSGLLLKLLPTQSRLQFNEYHREYYTDAERHRETRRLTQRRLENSIAYPMGNALTIRHHLSIVSERDRFTFPQDTSWSHRIRTDNRLHNQTGIQYHRSQIRIWGDWRSEQQLTRSRTSATDIRLPADYRLRNNNYNTGITIIDVLPGDSLTLQAGAGILHFDTPDTNNYDDRDESKYRFAGKWYARPNTAFSMQIGGSVYLHHLVYLSGKRSAQNHWNRVYRLEQEFLLNLPLQMRWNSRQSLFANYFVYDYEDSSFIQQQSMVFRGFNTAQSVKYHIRPAWGLESVFALRLEDDGALDWQAWVQDRYHTRNTWRYELLGFYQSGSLFLRLGPTYSERHDYQHHTGAAREKIYHNIRRGVMVNLGFQPWMKFKYHLESISQSNASQRWYQNGNLELMIFI